MTNPHYIILRQNQVKSDPHYFFIFAVLNIEIADRFLPIWYSLHYCIRML